MVFVAGALAGLVAGVAAGMLMQRRAGGSNLAQSRGFATAVAMVALIVAAIALARSDRGSGRSAATTPAATTSPTTAASTGGGEPATTTTTTAIGSTEPSGVVSVPNVEHLSRSEAIPILQHAGLKVSIETLALSNVPANFVISQTPLPGAMTTPGTTVTLVISAAA